LHIGDGWSNVHSRVRMTRLKENVRLDGGGDEKT